MLEFKLTPAYCLFNGVGIIEQKGSEILFIVENIEDIVLQGRLSRAFRNYLDMIKLREDCPENYRKEAHIDFIKGTREQLRKCVSGLYRLEDSELKESQILETETTHKEAAAILLLDTLLQDAREIKASDIHIEGNTVRFRVCGKLETKMELQNERCSELIQRIKLLAGMNVIEKRKSQDGRFIYGNENPIFIRAASTGIIGKNQNWDESIVLRLLDTTRTPLSINLLGFNENQLDQIDEIKKMQNGLILVCGPTGAGKSTTVASLLIELEKTTSGKIKIISLEDPPEYVIPGVTQIQIDESRGNSFNEVLSHVFRQDPDVIMIGEIRDEVSAAAAVRAALTGHLVFATLHTSGAGEAFLRLENLGVERNLIASVIKGIICQTLDFEDGHASLCADVAIPKQKIGSLIRPYFCEEQIDELFFHVTNYSEVLKKTLINFKESKNHIAVDKLPEKKIKHPALWIGGENGKKIHGKIG